MTQGTGGTSNHEAPAGPGGAIGDAGGAMPGVGDGGPAGAGGGDGAMPEEQRRANAALRRQREQQEAISRAVSEAVSAEREKLRAEAQAEMSGFFRDAQIRNPINDTPITNMDEFRAWKREHEAGQMRRDLEEGRLTPEAIERAVASSPAMKRAEEVLRKSEEAARQRDLAEFHKRVESEVSEITKLDPAVKSLDDIMAMPTAKEFTALVQRGNNYIDAFRLANWERLSSAAAQAASAAAKQQAISNIDGKGHMATAAGSPRGGGSVPVPAGEMSLFRELMPDATEAEIRDYYNKNARAGA